MTLFETIVKLIEMLEMTTDRNSCSACHLSYENFVNFVHQMLMSCVAKQKLDFLQFRCKMNFSAELSSKTFLHFLQELGHFIKHLIFLSYNQRTKRAIENSSHHFQKMHPKVRVFQNMVHCIPKPGKAYLQNVKCTFVTDTCYVNRQNSPTQKYFFLQFF